VSSWGTRYLGNPELKPEESITYDGAVEFADSLSRAELVFFHTEFDNKILGYYDTTLGARTWKNVAGATIQGVEANLSTDVGALMGWFLSVEPFVSITYHTRYSAKDRTEIERYGKTLLYTPKWAGSLGIRVMGERCDARVVARYNGKEKVTDWNYSSPTYGKTIEKAGFAFVNLKGSCRLNRVVELGLSVENLLNRSYEYVLGYPMPERTLTGLLRLRI
jgi:vitamin B12 transporter